MKFLTLTTLCLTLTACGTPQVWYQSSKTPAETYRDFGQCKMDASKTVSGGRGANMGLMQRNIAIDDILTGCMYERGYKIVKSKDLPDSKNYPKR